MHRIRTVVLAVFVLLFVANDVHGQSSTQIMVRAVSHDAKIIGSGVGGARIVIQDSATGEVLDEGIQEGGTGSTDRIVVAPRERDGVVFDTDGAAGYLAQIAISEPTWVDITAYGPLNDAGLMARSSKRMQIVPGEDVHGEGIILELNGFTVNIEAVDVTGAGVLHVTARVTMLCGCPTEPGGLWDADDIQVRARLLKGTDAAAAVELSFAGTSSTFAGELRAPDPGSFVLEITASEPSEGNFGSVRRHVDLR